VNFVIRDDDTCYFTRPEQLTRVYSPFWDRMPISLAVVPFHACTKSGNIPRKFWDGEDVFPVGENEALVAFLREQIERGRLSIMLHGYSHKIYENGYEFEVGDNLSEKVREGKEYLERLFGVQIISFVAPHNALSKKGLQAVVENGLNLAGYFLFRPSKGALSAWNVVAYLRRRLLRWRSGTWDYYPFVLRFRHHAELPVRTLMPSTRLEDLYRYFEIARRYNGVFCLATHYWEANEHPQMREVLWRFLDYVDRDAAVECRTADEILMRYTRGDAKRTVSSGRGLR